MPKDYVTKVENSVDDNGVLIVRGTPLRRILAELADVLTAFILAITIYGIGFQRLFGYDHYTSEMSKISSSMTTAMVERNLYKKSNDGTILLKADLTSYWSYYYLAKSDESYQKREKYEPIKDYYTLTRIDGTSKLSQYQYNTEILKLPSNIDGNYDDTIFAYDSNNEDPLNSEPIFKEAIQTNLNKYYLGNTDAYEPKNAYDTVSTFFSKIYDQAFSEAVKDETYMNLVLEFASKMWSRSYLQSAAIISSYLLGSIITFLLIPLIQLSGLTLGKRVAKLQVNDQKGNKPRWYSFLIRGLVQTIAYCLMIPFIGVMSYGFGAFEMPFLEIGSFNLNLSFFGIIGLLLSTLSLVMMFVTPEKQSLHDLASLTYVNTSDIKTIRDAATKLEKKENGREERN